MTVSLPVDCMRANANCCEVSFQHEVLKCAQPTLRPPQFELWLTLLGHAAVFEITEADGSKVENPRKLEALAQVSNPTLSDAELPSLGGAFLSGHLSVEFAKELIVPSCTMQMLSAEDGSNALIGDLLHGIVQFSQCLPL